MTIENDDAINYSLNQNKEALKKQKMLRYLSTEIEQLKGSMTSIVAVSTMYNEKIEAALTSPKRDLYKKKLQKNNKMLSSVLIKLDQNIRMRDALINDNTEVETQQ